MRKAVIQKKPSYALGSVDKALQLIQILRDVGNLRLTDAAAELEISPSSAHRLLAMLVYRGFAIQDDSRTYLPGPAMGELPFAAPGTMKLKVLVQPHLELLAAQTEETCNLMIRVGTNVRFLSTVESSNILRVGDRKGAVLPAARTSGGKALLAEFDDEALARLYRPDDDDVSQQAEFADLVQDLERVRRQGFATNLEATETGVSAIGTAIHSGSKSVAAISVSLPATRLNGVVLNRIADLVLSARKEIESEFAAYPVD
jgi:DNA-binding IclR family transcriptional regulator